MSKLVRISISHDATQKLLDGDTLTFKIPPASVDTIEVCLEEDRADRFGRIFGKLWDSALDRFEKLTK